MCQRENKNKNQRISWDNQNEHTVYENLWKADKGKFIVINIYIEKHISIKQPNVISQWMKKKEQTKLKISRRKK